MKKMFLLLLCMICLLFSGEILVAGINYSGITDTTIVYPITPDSINYYEIDLNNNGITDIKIGIKYFYCWEGYHPPYDGFQIFIISDSTCQSNPGPFDESDIIGDTLGFKPVCLLYEHNPGGCYPGSWVEMHKSFDVSAYTGFEYLFDGNTHFGWIKLSLNRYSFTVESFAWNNIAGQPIEAGQIN